MTAPAEAALLLSRGATPTRYVITLAPDLVSCTFTGSVRISLELTGAACGARTLELHSRALALFDVTFAPRDEPPLSCEGIAYDLLRHTVTLRFSGALRSGELSLRFSGALNDELAGFYRSRYTLRGETRYMAVTQFEATDARRCFPCIDEPAAKATFALTVRAPADRTVVSNMHALRVETSADGRARTHTFAETPRMSSYLVACCVGEWDTVEGLSPRLRVPTRVFCPPGRSAQGAFALSVALPAIDYLEALFGVPYMGSKSDLLAIPDFAAGAMENVGCVTYREAALLIDEQESSFAMRQRVAQVVCHELSHQWFGNLVTWVPAAALPPPRPARARARAHLCLPPPLPSSTARTQDEVVGQSVAERGLCLARRVLRAGCALPAVGHVGRVCRDDAGGGLCAGRHGEHAPRRGGLRDGGRDQRGL